MTHRESGWTLLEMMIIIAVLSILASIIYAQFVDLKTRAVESALRGDITYVRGALSIYYSDTEDYPIDLNIAFSPGSKYISSLPTGWIPPVAQYGNPGHTVVMQGVQNYTDVPANPTQFLGEGTFLLGYVRNPGSVNSNYIFINCQHRDTNGVYWTTR